MADFLPTGKPAKPKLASLAKAFHGSCACGRGGGNGTHRAPPGHRGRVAGVACLKWQRTHVRPDQRQRAQCCSACCAKMLCAAQNDQTEECVGVAVRVLERTQHVVREASGPHNASPTETRVGGASVQVAVDALPTWDSPDSLFTKAWIVFIGMLP